MMPIFEQSEHDGIYEATIFIVTDKGVSIQENLSVIVNGNNKVEGLRIMNDRFAKKLNQINNESIKK